MKDNVLLDLLWDILQCQLDNLEYEIIRSVIPDAIFITAFSGNA